MKTLSAVIDGRAELNAQERDSLFALLSTRCGAKTKASMIIVFGIAVAWLFYVRG